jgi:hypothetical protein
VTVLQKLRESIGAIDGSLQKLKIAYSGFESGFPQGGIVEVIGTGKTEFVAKFLSEHEQEKAAWIESEFSVNPCALSQKGVALGNVLFMRTQRESIWTVREVLQSQVFSIVVTSFVEFPENDLRRMQILAERAKVNLFILSQEFHHSFVPQLQLQVSRDQQTGRLEWKIKKQRGSW